MISNVFSSYFSRKTNYTYSPLDYHRIHPYMSHSSYQYSQCYNYRMWHLDLCPEYMWDWSFSPELGTDREGRGCPWWDHHNNLADNVRSCPLLNFQNSWCIQLCLHHSSVRGCYSYIQCRGHWRYVKDEYTLVHIAGMSCLCTPLGRHTAPLGIEYPVELDRLLAECPERPWSLTLSFERRQTLWSPEVDERNFIMKVYRQGKRLQLHTIVLAWHFEIT